jgi:hypothetical protein
MQTLSEKRHPFLMSFAVFFVIVFFAPNALAGDEPRSYVSLIADASLRKGIAATNGGASGSGALGVDLQVPVFGLFFVGQASASNALRGDRTQLASSITAPGIGNGAGILDIRITPLGKKKVSEFIRGISLRLDGSITGFDWETKLDDGTTYKSKTIYNFAFSTLLSYRLDVVGIARENGVRIGREQDIVFAVELGFTGRYIGGDAEGFGRIMTPNLIDTGKPIPLFFPAPVGRIQLAVNHARFFIEAPYFLDKGIPELRGLALFVGGGVRGDVYSIFNSGT